MRSTRMIGGNSSYPCRLDIDEEEYEEVGEEMSADEEGYEDYEEEEEEEEYEYYEAGEGKCATLCA